MQGYVTVDLQDASVDQLAQFAEILGAELPEKQTKGSLLALIEAIRPGGKPLRIPEQTTFHQPASADSAIPPSCYMVVEEERDGVMVKRQYVGIRLPETDRPGGKQPVPVSVNGIRFDVPRNMDCWVPMEFYVALDNSRRWDYLENERGLKEPREVHDYPFNFVRPSHGVHEQRDLARKLHTTVAA